MNYWERRQQQLNSQLEKDEAKLKKRLSSFYDSEYGKLEKEIALYYQKYGENNVIQYRKLMESLPEEDKRLLIERMEEFADKYPQYEDMLPVRESIYKLNRLEGLQMSIRLQQIEIGAVDNTQLQEHLEKQAVRGVNAAAETLGFGKNFYGVDSAVVKSVVNMAWANGGNFSISIWKNTNKLANYLCTDIAQAIARGDSYDKVAKNMKKRFGYPVMEGTTSKVLNAGIGHIEETAGIGESGNCVLCGHNGSRYGTFFTPLSQISIGDEVMITDKNELKHSYEVTETEIVNPYDNSIKTQGDEKELTLFTCSKKGTMRFVVRCIYKEAVMDE